MALEKVLRLVAPLLMLGGLAACGGGGGGGGEAGQGGSSPVTVRVQGLEGELVVTTPAGGTLSFSADGDYAVSSGNPGQTSALAVQRQPAHQQCSFNYESATLRSYRTFVDVLCHDTLSGPATLRPYEVTVLTLAGDSPLRELAEASVTLAGSIGGVPVSVVAGGDEIAFLVPPLPAGSHRLTFTHEGTTYEYRLESTAALALPADPEQYVRDYFSSVETSLQADIATASGATLTLLQAALADLQAQKPALDSFSPTDWATVARVLAANEGDLEAELAAASGLAAVALGASPLSFGLTDSVDDDFKDCVSKLAGLEVVKKYAARAGAVAVVMAAAGSAVSLPVATAFATATIIRAKLNGTLASSVSRWRGMLDTAIDTALEACVSRPLGRVNEWFSEEAMAAPAAAFSQPAGISVLAAAVAEPVADDYYGLYAHHHAIPERMTFVAEFRMHPVAYSLCRQLSTSLSRFSAILPSALLSKLSGVKLRRVVPMAPASIASIDSDIPITGNLVVEGPESATVTFRFADSQPEEPQRFVYKVAGTAEGKAVTAEVKSVLHPWMVNVYGTGTGDFVMGPKAALLGSTAALPLTSSGGAMVLNVNVAGHARFVVEAKGASEVLVDAIGFQSGASTWWLNSIPGPEFLHRGSNFNPTGAGCSWGSGMIGPGCVYYRPDMPMSADSWVEGPPDGITISSVKGGRSYYGYTTLNPQRADLFPPEYEYANSLSVYLRFKPINDPLPQP